jgi:hypothetical protein
MPAERVGLDVRSIQPLLGDAVAEEDHAVTIADEKLPGVEDSHAQP